MGKSLQEEPARENGASATARAFATYSLVPYLGILFCPGALLMGGLGVIRSYSLPAGLGRRTSYLSIVVGLTVFCVQLFLWWILYQTPEWAQLGGIVD